MASIVRRSLPVAVALLIPALLPGQHARTISVDQARTLLGGEFYAVPDLAIVKVEDVSYECRATCTVAVRVQQEVKPNEVITITETRVPDGLTTSEAALSSARFKSTVNDRRTMRTTLRTREVGQVVLRITGPFSDGRLASMLKAAVPR